ncbi:hypothetical protein NUACC26_006810 [Scytonema sp. NUACC26]
MITKLMKTHQFLLVLIVIVSQLGLFYFAVIDQSVRSVFIDVAKLTIAAYLGYLIPNSPNK